jgi:2-oxoisovalerate dehydrogenase E1 component
MAVTGAEDLDELELVLLDGFGTLPRADGGDPTRPLAPGSSMTAKELDEVFECQLDSRHLDHAARWLRQRGVGFYTIGSAGHESNALVANVLRPTDPALLHYRSGAFYLARGRQVAGHDGVRDVLLGCWRRPTSRSPAAGTRCSATPTWR